MPLPILRRYDLTSQAFKADPLPVFSAMRSVGPIVRTSFPMAGDVLLTTTYPAAVEVLKDHESFVMEPRHAGRPSGDALPWWVPRTFRILSRNMLVLDDPEHKRLRQLVDQAFARREVLGMEGDIRKIADDLLNHLPLRPDVVQNYARDLPLLVICRLLVLPEQDLPEFKRSMGRVTAGNSIPATLSALPGISRLMKRMRQVFEDPQAGGLVAHLVELGSSGNSLTEDEMLAMTFLLFFAGHETTTHLISWGIYVLSQGPEALAQASGDPERWSLTIEELLRWASPVQFSKPRYAARTVKVSGVEIPKGQRVMVSLAAANADPSKFERPEEFLPDRHPNPHLSFGSGVHFCLGLQLARLEARVALQAFFERFPAPAIGQPQFTPRAGLRGLHALPFRPT